MSDSYVEVAPDSTGKKIRTVEQTVSANVVEQQVVTLAKSDGTLDPTITVTGTLDVNQGGTWTVQPGNVANTVAWLVDGSATTQPISGSVTITTLPALAAGTNTIGTATVTGTVNVNALPTGTNIVGGFKLYDASGNTAAAVTSSSALKVDASATTQPVSGSLSTVTTIGTVNTLTGITNPLPAGTNVIGHVIVDSGSITSTDTPPTLTKGTQGATGYSVQDLKDAGRTQVTLYVDATAGTTAEAMATMSIVKGGSTASAATSYAVTSNKTFRIQFFGSSVKNSTTTATNSRARLRAAPSSLSTTSPVMVSNEAGTPAAVANCTATDDSEIPDGIELVAGTLIGVSHIESASTSTFSCCIVGYEY